MPVLQRLRLQELEDYVKNNPAVANIFANTPNVADLPADLQAFSREYIALRRGDFYPYPEEVADSGGAARDPSRIVANTSPHSGQQRGGRNNNSSNNNHRAYNPPPPPPPVVAAVAAATAAATAAAAGRQQPPLPPPRRGLAGHQASAREHDGRYHNQQQQQQQRSQFQSRRQAQRQPIQQASVPAQHLLRNEQAAYEDIVRDFQTRQRRHTSAKYSTDVAFDDFMLYRARARGAEIGMHSVADRVVELDGDDDNIL